MKKFSLSFIFVLWLMIILTMFFVIQKPDFLSMLAGLKKLFLASFIPFLMASLAACMEAYLIPDSDPAERQAVLQKKFFELCRS